MSARLPILAILLVCACSDGAPAPPLAETIAATSASAPASAPLAVAGAVLPASALVTSAPVGDTLLSESFDGAAAVDGWKRMSGAEIAAAPENEIGWDDGAVRMRATRETRKWNALYRELDTGGASWVTVSAKIRTDGIDSTDAPRQNCNLFLKHAGGIGGTRIVTGTQTTSVRRRLEVTPGKVTLGFFCSMPGQAWFDDIKMEKSVAPVWTEKKHGHFLYRTLPGDAVDDDALAYNEESFRIVSEYFGVKEHAPIPFMKYPDLATLEELTGFVGNAFRQGPVIHRIWTRDRHEMVHVLADAWGDPPALIAEGLAVVLSGSWQGKPVRDYARELAQKGGWHAPSSLIGSQRFRSVPDLESYAVGAAFVAWVEATHGRAKVKDLYGKLGNKASDADNLKRFEELLGPAAAVDTKVKAWVEAPQ